MAKEDLRVSELFPMLNQEKTTLGILDWGVKMTTLEDGMLTSKGKTLILVAAFMLSFSFLGDCCKTQGSSHPH